MKESNPVNEKELSLCQSYRYLIKVARRRWPAIELYGNYFLLRTALETLIEDRRDKESTIVVISERKFLDCWNLGGWHRRNGNEYRKRFTNRSSPGLSILWIDPRDSFRGLPGGLVVVDAYYVCMTERKQKISDYLTVVDMVEESFVIICKTNPNYSFGKVFINDAEQQAKTWILQRTTALHCLKRMGIGDRYLRKYIMSFVPCLLSKKRKRVDL